MNKIVPNILVQHLEKIIVKRAKSKKLKIIEEHQVDNSRKCLYVTLQEEDHNTVEYEEDNIPVIDICDNLKLSVNISFFKDTKDKKDKIMGNRLDFVSISLKFFHIDTLICKAEWSDSDADNLHPQPHWHFVKEIKNDTIGNFSNYLVIKENSENRGFTDDNEKLKNDSKIFDVSRMHFAMCSDWQQNEDCSNINKPDLTSLENWFSGCIKSVIEEHNFRQ